jgi:4-hydroxy 2-oxovalerate aldolase
LELALANTLTALDCGVQMIDATVTGMGRGAGNLKTELFFTVIQKKTGCDIDFNALSNLVDRFEILRKNHEWGTNLPYMVSGANSLPQKEVMELVTKRFYSMNSIIHALQTKMGISIRSDLRSFKPQVSFDKVIIVGGGANAQLHSDAISRLLDNNQEYCLIHASSKNAKFYRNLKVKQYFCLVGNEGYRLEKVFNDFRTVDGDCILPPPPRVMGTYIPSTFSEFSYELPSITFTNRIFDSHTVLALQTSLMLDAKEVGLVGYDGYNEGLITQHERAISEENEYLFQDFQKNTRIRLFSLTTTNYRSLSIESLYSKFI